MWEQFSASVYPWNPDTVYQILKQVQYAFPLLERYFPLSWQWKNYLKLETDQHNSEKGLDKQGFEVLFRKHFKGLTYFALEYVKDHDIARDIVQEAFVNFWEKRDSIELNRSPKSYLGTAVRNRCLNYLRDHKKFDHSILEFEGLGGSHDYVVQDQLVVDELKASIEKATRELPKKCREIFLLNRLEHKKYQEIADELNISVKTVEAQMSKALRIMRVKLAEFISLFILIIEIFKT